MANLTTTSSIVDSDASKWMKFWMEQDLRKNKSFVAIMFLSSAPFLGVVLLIFVVFAILSFIFKIHAKNKHKKNIKNVKVLENFLILYNKTKQERNQREINFQQNFKNRRISQMSINSRQFQKDFGLPDEDKVPFSLLKEALANSNAQADQEVVKIIDKLINPPRPKKANSPVMELVNRLHNLGDTIKDKKKTEIREKFGQYDNSGYEDPDIGHSEGKKNLNDHGIRIVIEDFDGTDAKNSEQC